MKSWLSNVKAAAAEVSDAKGEAKRIRSASSDDVGADDGRKSTARMEAAHEGFWGAVKGRR